jgi:hypothetical protein
MKVLELFAQDFIKLASLVLRKKQKVKLFLLECSNVTLGLGDWHREKRM